MRWIRGHGNMTPNNLLSEGVSIAAWEPWFLLFRFKGVPVTPSDETLPNHRKKGRPRLTFEDFATKASLYHPYPFQVSLATEGFPEVIAVETGAGKTAAVVLGWMWRRFHADEAVRRSTPHWLVICEPLRALIEQAEGNVRQWVANAGLADQVGVHVLMGGSDPTEKAAATSWRSELERPAIILGTLDMLLSRALNRGYAMGRFSWPVDFGLLNNGAHWMFDEVQLMGPALGTSRQLDAFRRQLGTALPTRSTWMSATVDRRGLSTVDNRDLGSVLTLSEADRSHPELAKRLDATKLVTRLDASPKHRPASIAQAALEHHMPGALTLVIMNTVGGAQDVHRALSDLVMGGETVLLHSRFRPADRRAALERALAPVEPDGPGRVVVSTQVVEAGVDISAATLLTEAAPWPSIVQRAGRCNRDGTSSAARLVWIPVDAKQTGPYEATDVSASAAALAELEGTHVTATSMRDREVASTQPVYQVLRKTDLLALFDTAPDMSGNDVDVAHFIRDTEDLDFYVAWRDLGAAAPADDAGSPTGEDLCPAPLSQRRSLRWSGPTGRPLAWRFDHLADGKAGGWVRAGANDVRPSSPEGRLSPAARR